jgi:hypothetical protein
LEYRISLDEIRFKKKWMEQSILNFILSE